jgi:hypothetical protein
MDRRRGKWVGGGRGCWGGGGGGGRVAEGMIKGEEVGSGLL